ncbi:DUF58 domain-containing protein [Bacteriovoracaceae bacterium]|nr:DUF58 domain-containing protein [Bacteriovoracaceae bacterium]
MNKILFNEKLYIQAGLLILILSASFIIPILFLPTLVIFFLYLIIVINDFLNLKSINLPPISVQVSMFPVIREIQTLSIEFNLEDNINISDYQFDLILDSIPGIQTNQEGLFHSIYLNEEIFIQIEYSCPSLGFYQIKHLTFIVHSKYKYWFQVVKLNCSPQDFRVLPSNQVVKEKELSKLLKGQKIYSQTDRRVNFNSLTDHYYCSREFVPGDNLRYVDFKKFAKFKRLYTKTYETHLKYHHLILMDLGRGMEGTIEESHKVDYFLPVISNLIRLSLEKGDEVSFIAFSQNIDLAIIKGTGHHDFLPLFRNDPRLKPKLEESNYHNLVSFLSNQNFQRSLLYLYGDLTRPATQTYCHTIFRPVIYRHRSLFINLQNSHYNLEKNVLNNPINSLSDYSNLIYDYWMEKNLRKFSLEINSLGGSFVNVPTDYWMSANTKIYNLFRISFNV